MMNARERGATVATRTIHPRVRIRLRGESVIIKEDGKSVT